MIFFYFFLGCWTPKLGMLPAFLNEPDLGNVAGLLGRIRLGKCCRPSWMNQTWECKLLAFLDELDLGILLDSGLEM
ncbi:hypothetical protein RCL_jg1823.t1 [Rhizophagus clarus]|uniref:Uncharacterized protein n=1 Tax=Rhizophagus clarus TaxID=94130 RepID=A0A8H3L777_9GLOM|nr:hypothetical protein RCL_jg1823.t1 [Rhizophagus clarus]